MSIYAVSAATAGLQWSTQRADQAASQIAKIGTSVPGTQAIDPVRETASLLKARDSFGLNAISLRVASDMEKQAIDILA